MTVQDATQMWSRHDADLKSKDGKRFTASIKENYQIVTDATDTLTDVLKAGNLPDLGDSYPGTPQVRVVSRKPKQQSPVLWMVAVSYEGEYGQLGRGTFDGSPLLKPATLRWGKTEREIPVFDDLDNKPLWNKNQEPIYDENRTVSDITLAISRNYAGVDLAATHQYLHSVNSDVFAGFAAGTGRLTEFGAEAKYNEITGGYFEVNATIQFRYPWNTTPDKAWYFRVRHEGFKAKDINGEAVRARDGNGVETAQPVLLDEDGYELKEFEVPVFLEFRIYSPLPYNSLGLLDNL